MCAENLTLQVLAAPVLLLSVSPIALELWCSIHVLSLMLNTCSLYLWDQSHNLYFYYCKVKEKMELSEFVLLKCEVAMELTFGAKLRNWRAHANV